MLVKRLVFETIDLDAHASVCVAFRRDSYLCRLEACLPLWVRMWDTLGNPDFNLAIVRG